MVIHAHSLILQARSTYFARALNNDWKEANQGVIHKPNISPPVFERILHYWLHGSSSAFETSRLRVAGAT